MKKLAKGQAQSRIQPEELNQYLLTNSLQNECIINTLMQFTRQCHHSLDERLYQRRTSAQDPHFKPHGNSAINVVWPSCPNRTSPLYFGQEEEGAQYPASHPRCWHSAETKPTPASSSSSTTVTVPSRALASFLFFLKERSSPSLQSI